MIKEEPKDFIPLEKPLRVEVNPRLTVRFENGVVTFYSRGNTIRMSEWEYDEISMEHSHQRIHEAVARHKKHKK